MRLSPIRSCGGLGYRGARRRAAPSLERRTGDRAHRTQVGWGRPGKNAAPRRAASGHGGSRAPATRCGRTSRTPSAKLAWIKTDPRLYRAYLLKESLHVFSIKGEEGVGPRPVDLLGVALSHPGIRRACRPHPNATGWPSAPPRPIQGLIRSITESAYGRVAFGFRSPQALIA